MAKWGREGFVSKGVLAALDAGPLYMRWLLLHSIVSHRILLPCGHALAGTLRCAAGLSRGQVQKLQQDAGKWMGMASLLCESAGWWPLATLYSNLSQVGGWEARRLWSGVLSCSRVAMCLFAHTTPVNATPPCCYGVTCPQMAAAGVRQDLLPLMHIPEMDVAKARALFKAGLRDAQASLSFWQLSLLAAPLVAG